MNTVVVMEEEVGVEFWASNAADDIDEKAGVEGGVGYRRVGAGMLLKDGSALFYG
jgi:hypothetical protein